MIHRNYLRTALIFLGLIIGDLAQAKTIYFGASSESVTVVAGVSTLFRFQKEVRTISQSGKFEIGAANLDQANYSLLAVRPRSGSGSQDVVFILTDGTTVKLKLIVVSKAIPERTDSIYDFKPKESFIEGQEESEGGGSWSDLGLMKAMIRGDRVTHYDIRTLRRQLTPPDPSIEIELVQVYSGNQFNGYIYRLKNQSPTESKTLDLQTLQLGTPNAALLSQVDRSILGPKEAGSEETLLRVVAKPSSLSTDLQLPLAALPVASLVPGKESK